MSMEELKEYIKILETQLLEFTKSTTEISQKLTEASERLPSPHTLSPKSHGVITPPSAVETKRAFRKSRKSSDFFPHHSSLPDLEGKKSSMWQEGGGRRENGEGRKEEGRRD
jgi:hypothetical protein